MDAFSDDTKSDVAAFITEVYVRCKGILNLRLAKLIDIYESTSGNLKLPDRGIGATKKSVEILTGRFNKLALAAESINSDKKHKGEKVTPKDLKPIWSSLHNMCSLMMDEATFLQKRIHDLDGIHKVNRGYILARRAFYAAIVAALLNLTKDLWWPENSKNSAFAEKAPSVEKPQPSKVEATVEVHFKADALPTEFTDIAKAIPELTKAIDAHAKAMSDASPDGLAASLQELNTSVSEIQFAIDNSKSPLTADNITTLQSFLDEISKSIAQIGPAIANQKAPVVNLTPRIEIKAPSQTLSPPDKKAIGLINIDASKVGASDTEKPDQSEKSRPRLNPPHR